MKTRRPTRMVINGIVGFTGMQERAIANPRATFSGQGSVDEPSMQKVDDFPGVEGDCWAGPWQVIQRSEIDFHAAIAKDKPFEQGKDGYLLQMDYERMEGKTSLWAVGRKNKKGENPLLVFGSAPLT